MRVMDALPDKDFKRMFRVDRATFDAILKKIHPRIRRTMPQRGKARSIALPPKLMLACTLRYLAGDSYHNITRGLEISKSAFYRAVDDVVDAINAEYTFVFDPADEDQLESHAAEWKARKGDYILGIVGAVDGIAVKIRHPRGEFDNPAAFLNRKGAYALVVQAVCDARRRFIFVHEGVEGSAPDSVVWGTSSLGRYVQDHGLPAGYSLVGDGAFPLSNSLLTPYPGTKLSAEQDAFSYCQAYYCKEIAEAFDSLNCRWGIFWRPLEMSVEKAERIITACMKLHNVCIDARDADFPVDQMGFDGLLELVEAFDPQEECALAELSLMHCTNRRRETSLVRDHHAKRAYENGHRRP